MKTKKMCHILLPLISCLTAFSAWAQEPGAPLEMRYGFEVELTIAPLMELSAFYDFDNTHPNDDGPAFEFAIDQYDYLLRDMDAFGRALELQPRLLQSFSEQMRQRLGATDFAPPTLITGSSGILLSTDREQSAPAQGEALTYQNGLLVPSVQAESLRASSEFAPILERWREVPWEEAIEELNINDLPRDVKAALWEDGFVPRPRESNPPAVANLLARLQMDYQNGFIEFTYDYEDHETSGEQFISDVRLFARLTGRSNQFENIQHTLFQQASLANSLGRPAGGLGLDFTVHNHYSVNQVLPVNTLHRLNLMLLLERMALGIYSDFIDHTGYRYSVDLEIKGLMHHLNWGEDNSTHVEIRSHTMALEEQVWFMTDVLTSSPEDALRMIEDRVQSAYQQVRQGLRAHRRDEWRGDETSASFAFDMFELEMDLKRVYQNQTGSPALMRILNWVFRDSSSRDLVGFGFFSRFWAGLLEQLRQTHPQSDDLAWIENRNGTGRWLNTREIESLLASGALPESIDRSDFVFQSDIDKSHFGYFPVGEGRPRLDQTATSQPDWQPPPILFLTDSEQNEQCLRSLHPEWFADEDE